MKVKGIGAVAMLSLVLGVAGPAFAEERNTAGDRMESPSRQQVWMQHRAKSWNSDPRTWVQRGGYQGVRVPDAPFIQTFGEDHTFRINSLPYRTVNNETSFQYNGYWMSLVDPWPETWADGWYDQDDVHVRYDNGYYLHNTRYPDVAISLQFSK